jgi:hypothetical protein
VQCVYCDLERHNRPMVVPFLLTSQPLTQPSSEIQTANHLAKLRQSVLMGTLQLPPGEYRKKKDLSGLTAQRLVLGSEYRHTTCGPSLSLLLALIMGIWVSFLQPFCRDGG